MDVDDQVFSFFRRQVGGSAEGAAYRTGNEVGVVRIMRDAYMNGFTSIVVYFLCLV